MNGVWAIGLKLSVVLMPFMVVWCTWTSRTLLLVEERVGAFLPEYLRRIAVIEENLEMQRRELVRIQIELGIKNRGTLPP